MAKKYNLKYELGTILYCISYTPSGGISIKVSNNWKYIIDTTGIFISIPYMSKYKLENCFDNTDDVLNVIKKLTLKYK